MKPTFTEIGGDDTDPEGGTSMVVAHSADWIVIGPRSLRNPPVAGVTAVNASPAA